MFYGRIEQMTYVYHILRDNPIGVWPLDSGVTDVSGFNRDGAITGTPTVDRPLAARGIASQYLDAAGFTFPVQDVMMVTKQQKSFSLEAWVKPHNATGLGNILARNTSGLFIDEGYLFFQVASPTVTTRIIYEWLDIGRTAHIVAVYDTNDLYLYVNGEIVASTPVDETVLTQGLTDTSPNLVTNTSGAFKMSVDTIAVYNYALSARTIQSHYSVGTTYPRVYDISRSNGAHIYLMSTDNANVKVALDLDTDEEWRDANSTNVGPSNGGLVNLTDPTTGFFAAGVWEKSIAFPAETAILQGSSLTWKASTGVNVYTALNDTSYTLLANGAQPFSGLDISTAQTLKIKIELPAGTDQSVVESMYFRAYTSKVITGSDADVVMALTSPSNVDLDIFNYNPVEFNDKGGMKIEFPASMAIAADDNFGGYTAVEFTLYLETNALTKTLFTSTGGSAPAITTNGSGQWVPNNLTALIVDGQVISGATTIPLNRWHHVIAIFAEQASVLTFLNGVNSRIGYLAVYTDDMSDIDTVGAQAIYANWVGTATLQHVEEDVITISEFGAKGYSFDWAIQPAG